MKRILLAILLAWTAIAPAIANACAAGCEPNATSMHHATDGPGNTNATDVPDCHGDAGDPSDSNSPDGGSMAVACFVASAASLPTASIPLVNIDISSEEHSSVLLPPLSFQTSAPTRPPQA